MSDELTVDRLCDACLEPLGDKPRAEVFMPDELLDAGQEHTILIVHADTCFDPATMQVA